MNVADKILSQVIEWAKREEPIRALILIGSRARNNSTDELADFDISVFTETDDPYIQSDQWLSRIGKVWLYIPEKFDRKDEIIPTRLVIFEDGVKVDFAFFGTHVLDELINSDELNTGYRVLLDKDGITERLKPPSFGKLKHNKPTEKEFVSLINEFWFEAYYVAKYLKRDELWLVKFTDWNTKEFLLKMIEWHEQSKYNWDYETYYMGKGMKSWVSPVTWESLHQAFAHFDSGDGWSSLLATMNLFRRLAKETAEMLEFLYPQEVDRHIAGFIVKIGEGQK